MIHLNVNPVRSMYVPPAKRRPAARRWRVRALPAPLPACLAVADVGTGGGGGTVDERNLQKRTDGHCGRGRTDTKSRHARALTRWPLLLMRYQSRRTLFLVAGRCACFDCRECSRFTRHLVRSLYTRRLLWLLSIRVCPGSRARRGR